MCAWYGCMNWVACTAPVCGGTLYATCVRANNKWVLICSRGRYVMRSGANVALYVCCLYKHMQDAT
jgi:hypothetical protein